MHGEGPLHADAEAHLAHGEGLLHAAALAPHDRALEDLDPLPGALDHPDVDLDGVAGAEVGDVVAQAVAIDRFQWGAWEGVLTSHRLSAGRNMVAVLGQDTHVVVAQGAAPDQAARAGRAAGRPCAAGTGPGARPATAA